MALILISGSARSQAQGTESAEAIDARPHASTLCVRPVTSTEAPLTPYLADLSLARELRKRRECLDAWSSGLDRPVSLAPAFPGKRTSSWTPAQRSDAVQLLRSRQTAEEAEVRLAREEAMRQHLEVMTRIFIRDREPLPQAQPVSEDSWLQRKQGASFDAQKELVEATGAVLVAASPPADAARWTLWKRDVTNDTVLYYFVQSIPGQPESQFAQIALTPPTHARLWVDALQRRLGGAEPLKKISSLRCEFEMASTRDEFTFRDRQVLSVAEGDRAVVILSSSRGVGHSLAARLSQARSQAPDVMGGFDRLVALSKVPGPHSPMCDALKDFKVTRMLGQPGMTRAQFHKLWHGLNGGVRALGNHEFDVSPEFLGDRLTALEVTPAMTFEPGDSADAKPVPTWKPRDHDEAEALLSKGLGQLAYRESAKDANGAELVRTIWRLGHGMFAVLSNRTSAGAPVSMTARVTKGLS